MEDELVQKAFMYLRDKTYPEGCTKNEKRCIRKKAEKLVARNGVMYYKKKDGAEVRFIIDKEEQKRILDSCHKHPTSGHMGTKKTLARITERFMWPGVTKDVYQLVETCDVCQRTGRKVSKAAPELHPVPVVSPWHHIGIDFIGPLSPASQGCSYILTISDYFSKFVQAHAMEAKHASGVAGMLFKVFMMFGLPRVITSDQGREFNNDLDTRLMEMMGIEHRLTTPYHPQANGLNERFNQTLQNMLVKFIAEKKESWGEYLDSCVYAYNSSRHESSKFTPFEIMFGRKAILPIDLAEDMACKKEILARDHPVEEELERIMEERRQRLESVKENILIAQMRQKQQYDCKHSNPEVFAVGALVLKKDFTRKKRAGGKLDCKWTGPYRIVRSLGRGLYRLEDVQNSEKVVTRVNGIHLKRYIQKEPLCDATNVMTSILKVDHDTTFNISESPSVILETTQSSPILSSPGHIERTPTSASSPAEASGSSLAQSGGFSPELDIPLSPIPKTPTSAVQAVHVQEPTLASVFECGPSDCPPTGVSKCEPDCLFPGVSKCKPSSSSPVVVSECGTCESATCHCPVLQSSVLNPFELSFDMGDQMPEFCASTPKKEGTETIPTFFDDDFKSVPSPSPSEPPHVKLSGNHSRKRHLQHSPEHVQKKIKLTCECRRRCHAQKSCVCRRNGQLCFIDCHPGHSCTNYRKSESTLTTTICSSKKASRHPQNFPSPWVVVNGIRLYNCHRLMLTSPTMWIDDEIVRATQNLLKKQFPGVGGLQPPALAQQCAMEPQTGEFIQVLNTGQSHWLTISNIGCPKNVIQVYDSMHQPLNPATKRIIADLMMSKERAISVRFAPVQWQSGPNDCGLFALAFATSLCVGHDPAAVLYDQTQMRFHLLGCLTKGSMTEFPEKSNRRKTKFKKVRTELLPVFCLCRLPDNGTRMVQCDHCKEWFHLSCVNLAGNVQFNRSWYCCSCKAKQ